VLVSDPEIGDYVFYRISPEGDIAPVTETAKLVWQNNRCWQYPHSVLNASDGSIWFGMYGGDLARYMDGRLQTFDWKDGLHIGTAHLREDRDGNVYALEGQAVHVFRPNQPARPTPDWVGLWKEYELASYRPIRDSSGHIWMFLKDRKGECSRWDGSIWHHIKVPFDTSEVSRAMTDDRGHLLVGMMAHPDGYFDIAVEGVKRHDNMESMLVGAVAQGARRFVTGARFQGCLVENGRLWYGYHNYPGFSLFDGERWDIFQMRDDVNYMYESPKHGIMIRTQEGKYYTYERGQMLELDYPSEEGSRWLLGPKSFQPFEEEFLKLHPELYLPVERAQDRRYRILVRQDGSGQQDKPCFAAGELLPTYVSHVIPAVTDGHWIAHPGGGMTPYRILAGKVIQCDFRDTPLMGKTGKICAILEDRAHNVWFDSLYGRGRHVFCKRLDNFRLKLDEVPGEAKRSVHISAQPILPGLSAEKLRLFWRFKGGSWQGGELGGSVNIRFPTDGTYRIEFLGMDPLGGTTFERPTVIVDARVPYPETILTGDEPFVIKDVTWTVPVKAVPSEPGAASKLTYRIDGGSWTDLSDGKPILTGAIEPGAHIVDFAAVEDEEYRDPTPIRLAVTYEPDFRFIVESRLHLIMGDDPSKAEQALSEIRMAGPEVIPVLKEKLEEARKAARLASALERLLREIQKSAPQ